MIDAEKFLGALGRIQNEVDYLRGQVQPIPGPTPDPEPPTPDPPVPVPEEIAKLQQRIGMNINRGGSDVAVWDNLLSNEQWVTDWSYRRLFPADPGIQTCMANIHFHQPPGAEILISVVGGELELNGKVYGPGLHPEKLPSGLQSAVVSVNKPGVFSIRKPGETPRLVEPRYGSAIAPFSVLRGLNILETNHSPQRTVSDMVQPDHLCQSSVTYGCAIEKFLMICEVNRSHAYVTVPHLAEASLIKRIAVACQSFSERTGLDVYAEYSNECWNGQFEQAKWVQGLGMSEFPIAESESESQWKERAKAMEYGRQAARMFSEFCQHAPDSIKVLAWMAASNWTQDYVLNQFVSDFGTLPDRFAIAPYLHVHVKDWINEAVEAAFGMPAREKYKQWRANRGEAWIDEEEDLVDDLLVQTWTPTKVVDQMFADGDGIARSKEWVDNYAEFGRKNGVKIMSYENGQHISPPVPRYSQFNQVLNESQKDSRWPEIYRRHRKNWVDAGCCEDVYLGLVQKPRPSGNSFGHLEHVDDTENIKWQALMGIVQASSKA